MFLDPINLSRVRARAKKSEPTCVERSTLMSYIYLMQSNEYNESILFL